MCLERWKFDDHTDESEIKKKTEYYELMQFSFIQSYGSCPVIRNAWRIQFDFGFVDAVGLITGPSHIYVCINIHFNGLFYAENEWD